MLPPPDPSQCPNSRDLTTLILSLGLCIGLVISYLPQHYRIISAGSSEGFSPWYLLLGATSSASGMLNLLIRQWGVFQCCRVISGGRCFESLLGFLQVSLQWFLFTIILILYLVYFPQHLKYQRALPIDPSPPSAYGAVIDTGTPDRAESTENRVDNKSKKAVVQTTPEWRLAVTLSVVVALHLILLTLLSLALLLNLKPKSTPSNPSSNLLDQLATFLGLSGTLLAVLQYAPQIYKTYRAKLVGALSLGTMAMQVPGSVLFVISIAMRPGTDWTSWLPYAVTGGLQGGLLILCLLWRRRQARLGIDDFGLPVNSVTHSNEEERLLPARHDS